MNHQAYCSEVAYFMQRLYRQKLTTSLGGNISLRVENFVYITPSQVDKDRLSANDIIIMDLHRHVLKAIHKSSMETSMHLSVYHTRPDIKAIVHAHSFWASLLALSNLQLVNDISDEAYYAIKRLAFCNYQTMGTSELANEVACKVKNADTLILKNHGILTTGKTLVEALERLEVLENIAHYSYLANKNIGLQSISAEAKKRIDELYL
ncbi:MAG: class II aldolase/adducin family protein [Bacteroidales bacterium]|nr:class II aldolase/adducin family protein [Bacteroidales bacterium]